MNRTHLLNMVKVTDTVKDNSLKMRKSNFVHLANVSISFIFLLKVLPTLCGNLSTMYYKVKKYI